MTISVFDLFKIGIGPSSSHTVGPMVAARQFAEGLSTENHLNKTARIEVSLFGSLGATGKGHGSDKAVFLGLLGEYPESVIVENIADQLKKIRSSNTLNLVGQKTIKFDESTDLVFYRKKSLPFHANGMTFKAFDDQAKLLSEKNYYSVGGGFIINEEQIPNESEGAASIDPIVQEQKPQPYTFNTADELLVHCQQQQISISEIMLRNEEVWRTRDEIFSQLLTIWHEMEACVKNGCKNTGVLPGGLKVERRAAKLYQSLNNHESHDLFNQGNMDWVNLYALAVNEENAAGGRVVTAPTNGAAGIIPAVMHYFKNFRSAHESMGDEDECIVRFLLAAGAIGLLIKQNASISGAEVGCQGEVGSACAMAAAGLTEVLGGTPEQVENAAEIGIEHNLGLTCDPIGGLVQVPCIERNAMGAVKAINASRLALRGDGVHYVSLDNVIATMRETGKDMMTKYKETARGGLAIQVIEIPVNIVEC